MKVAVFGNFVQLPHVPPRKYRDESSPDEGAEDGGKPGKEHDRPDFGWKSLYPRVVIVSILKQRFSEKEVDGIQEVPLIALTIGPQ
jgi:hypothetical protein